MNKNSKKKVEELNQKIIQAEIDRVRYPHNREEYGDTIKQSYSEISLMKKESDERSKSSNIAFAAALGIIGLFIFVFLVNIGNGNNAAPEISGFTTFSVSEITSPVDSATNNAVVPVAVNQTKKESLKKEVPNGK